MKDNFSSKYAEIGFKNSSMNTIQTTWQDRCSTITSALKHMLTHEIVVDAIFKKDKVNCLFAHKLVLAIWSPKFADWIAETEKKQMFSITFEEDADVLKIILQYLYAPDDMNCFSKMPMEKLIQALEISERYEITHLYKKCLSSLRRKKVNPSNVIDYFDYGLRKKLNDITQKCVKVFENEGIGINHIKEYFSITSLLNLLSLEKICMASEVDLLILAISWLSYQDNRRYKYQVLSFIDLYSINFTEYQNICKIYPHFFSDAELSSIILSKLRQDFKLLPSWYKRKVKTTIERNCSLCINIHNKVNISKPLRYLRVNKRKDLKLVAQKFGFEFKQFSQVKLLNIVLNFGPADISPKEFALQCSVSKTIPVKEYYIGTNEKNDKYKISFKFPLVLKSKENLTIKFIFRSGLLANHIQVVWPLAVQQHKLSSISERDCPKVNMSSSKLAFYIPFDKSEKYIVSSFYLNVCDNHRTFLSRKCIEQENISCVLDLDFDRDSNLEGFSENVLCKEDIKKEKIDVKMEVDDEQQNNGNTVSLKDVKPSIKTEPISLDSSCEILQVLSYDPSTYIKHEIIDLTDGL